MVSDSEVMGVSVDLSASARSVILPTPLFIFDRLHSPIETLQEGLKIGSRASVRQVLDEVLALEPDRLLSYGPAEFELAGRRRSERFGILHQALQRRVWRTRYALKCLTGDNDKPVHGLVRRRNVPVLVPDERGQAWSHLQSHVCLADVPPIFKAIRNQFTLRYLRLMEHAEFAKLVEPIALVVDDEPMILMNAADMISDEGYAVGGACPVPPSELPAAQTATLVPTTPAAKKSGWR